MRPDGVYLRLAFDDYINEPDCLGSTDKARLWLRREGWWWGSRNNPAFVRPAEGPELLFGECAHAALLEGMHAYESRYVVEPNRRDYPNALFTIDQIKTALKDAGVYPPRSSTFSKEDWAETAEIYLPDQPVWENVMADFRRMTASGRKGVAADVDFAIRTMRDLAMEDPAMAELLSAGSQFPILAEVSYFFTDEAGIRHRARFDLLLPPSTDDLKTMGNWEGGDLDRAVDNHIKRGGLDVQCADYQIARRHMMQTIRDTEGECIHSATEEELDHLYAMAHFDLDNKPDFNWIFFQKPSSAGLAPVLMPLIEKWGGPYHRAGFRKRAAALQTYQAGMAKFGRHRPWGRIEQPRYTIEEREPHITIGIYDWGPRDEAEGERDHFA